MKRFRKALILGYGRSGRAAEKLLQIEGCETVIWAQEISREPEELRALSSYDFDVCIVSPGFGQFHPWLREVSNAGISLIPEVELGWSRHKSKTVAVTGSNGKSTTVKWICETLQLSGKRAEIGGNYGRPACQTVLEHPNLDWLVLEVSSFQLETVRELQVDSAILLNVLPNHLDRYENMEQYRKTKARIFGLTESRGICLAPDTLLEKLQKDVAGKREWRSFGNGETADYRFAGGKIFQGEKSVLDISGTKFDSPVYGSCTAAAVAGFIRSFGILPEAAETTAKHFNTLPHRFQFLGKQNGITYINDSKSTNLAAMSAALYAVEGYVHLIAGGLPKESNYILIKEILAEKVRSVYIIGRASGAMFKAWNSVCPCVECGTLETAFSKAQNAAHRGESILLSPGCASFDQFKNFEERGKYFEKLFNQLKSTSKNGNRNHPIAGRVKTGIGQ